MNKGAVARLGNWSRWWQPMNHAHTRAHNSRTKSPRGSHPKSDPFYNTTDSNNVSSRSSAPHILMPDAIQSTLSLADPGSPATWRETRVLSVASRNGQIKGFTTPIIDQNEPANMANVSVSPQTAAAPWSKDMAVKGWLCCQYQLLTTVSSH
jgi:hypothetical protein